MKRVLALILAMTMILSLTACGNASSSSNTGTNSGSSQKKTYSLTVSGINGSINYTPIYIAIEKGFFKDAGLDVKPVLFDNGPVQMEALASDSWDLGATGVGGVLSGLISYDAYLVGASNTDNGTQTMWARKDSQIVAAGQGHNTINSKIYGDAASWKGATILCNSGTVLEYLLTKTLKGFGLTSSDVKVMTMDSPTANSAFLGGQGDVSVITGAISFSADKANYTMVSSGNLADTGLMCNFVASKKSYKDPDKNEAMKILTEVYWKTIDWMDKNPDEAAQMCSDFNAECGITLDTDTAKLYLKQDPYYDLKTVHEMMHNNAEGKSCSVMEQKLIDILDFFIENGKYKQGDDQKFLKHMDTSLVDAVYAEQNSDSQSSGEQSSK
jgi:ABC-type nitrate/sulfonate/bicarbonate transport system substrate-binding protein